MTLLVLGAIALLTCTGILSLLPFSSRRLATAIAALGGVAGCGLGAYAAIRVLLDGAGGDVALAWAAPIGPLVAGVDALSALFLAPLFVLGGVASIYGSAYLLGEPGDRSLAPPSLFFNLLLASMAVVIVARTAVLFLIAWEVMTLASYLLVTFDHEEKAVRRAGWVYLVAGHVGVAALIALFLVLGRGAGSLEFGALHAAASTAPAAVVFALALVGFGVKAGVVPLHVWLPEAHAAAPSHVSAVMSGVMIKVGLYGFLRALTFVTPAGWWGPVLVGFGAFGALLGIVLAAYQRDMKRVLAYSSIENMGIILLGIGVGFWGAWRGDLRVAALGFGGGLLHVWHHAAMKGLLFLSAGSVLHGAHTRDLERMGGLMRRMPWTGTAMIIGAAAISGLPPLAGFVGEWLIYLGLIGRGVTSGGGGLAALLVVGVLSLVGGVALLCFVRLVGAALLGSARSDGAAHAHESSPWMTVPLWALVLCTVVAPLVPGRLLAIQSSAIAQLGGAGVAERLLAESGALQPLVGCGIGLWAALALLGLALVRLIGRRAPVDDTWGCGYVAPTSRMQYGGAAFAQLFSSVIPSSLRARRTVDPPRSLFPAPGRFESDDADPLTRGLYEPFFARWGDRFAGLRWLQQGLLHVYVLYILVVVLGGLAWSAFHDWLGR